MVKKTGRPKTVKYTRQIIIIDCTDNEAELIRKFLPNTRQRAQILLLAAEGKQNDH